MFDTTFPSSPVTFIDVPEVSRFDATFVYNFFTPDESLDFTQQERHDERYTPRYVKFEFSPVMIRGGFERKTDASTLDVEDAIMEHDIATSRFIGVRFHDTQLDGKLTTIVSGAVNDKITRYNAGLRQQFNASELEIDDVLRRGSVNLFDVAALMTSGTTSTAVTTIMKAAMNMAEFNASFVNDARARASIDEQLARLIDVGVDVQMNAKFMHSLINSIVTDPISIHVDEMTDIINSSHVIQDDARRSMNSTGIDADEYEAFIEPRSLRVIDPRSFDGLKRVIGYVIDKTEIGDDGVHIVHRPIVVLDRAASKALDREIVYGRRYVYTIRTIAEIEFVTTLDGRVVAATMLVSSRPCMKRYVEAIENVPPPPPADFNVRWDHDAHAPRLTWTFPVNTQRDIKAWRVFRRTSLDEPFELMREINFDDSIVKHDSPRPTTMLTDTMKSPVSFYIDGTFDPGRMSIYAVCAVDAHGLMSNYSMQFSVSFDVSRGRTTSRLLSIAGAPISYPNMYVTQDDVIVDVISDSKHNDLDVYFDPDALAFTRGNVTHGIVVDDSSDGLYRLQFINCDVQRMTTLDIHIRPVQQDRHVVTRRSRA